jgi:hypothetical protein
MTYTLLSHRKVFSPRNESLECPDQGCEAGLRASNIISLLQLKTQTLIFTMPSEIRWLLALQRCDWCSFCIHLSAGAAALGVGEEEVYSRRRSDGCTVRPSLRRRDSFRRSERLSMGDAFCIGNLRFFERNEGFRRIAKRDILLSFECRYAALAVRKEEVYSRRGGGRGLGRTPPPPPAFIRGAGRWGVRTTRRPADGILLATASV